jgi:hypothetical protein
MECVGGNASLADSNPIHLGGQWIDSVSSYRLWRTYGFEEQSLVPIINFLPDDDLRKKAYLILSSYFHSCLHAQETGYSGHESKVDHSFQESKLKWAPNAGVSPGKAFAGELKKLSRGLSQIVVNSEGNVDALKLSYRVYTLPFHGIGQYSTEVVTGPYYGNDRGKSYERTIDFSPGEEIRALEVWVDPDLDEGVLRSLAIKTNKGRRLPNATGFYGANPKPGQSKPKPGYLFEIIEAPRVRALRGYSGAFVHSIGLMYLDLDANAKSRGFLLAMEPFLYPTGDYGPLL